MRVVNEQEEYAGNVKIKTLDSGGRVRGINHQHRSR